MGVQFLVELISNFNLRSIVWLGRECAMIETSSSARVEEAYTWGISFGRARWVANLILTPGGNQRDK